MAYMSRVWQFFVLLAQVTDILDDVASRSHGLGQLPAWRICLA